MGRARKRTQVLRDLDKDVDIYSDGRIVKRSEGTPFSPPISPALCAVKDKPQAPQASPAPPAQPSPILCPCSCSCSRPTSPAPPLSRATSPRRTSSTRSSSPAPSILSLSAPYVRRLGSAAVQPFRVPPSPTATPEPEELANASTQTVEDKPAETTNPESDEANPQETQSATDETKPDEATPEKPPEEKPEQKGDLDGAETKAPEPESTEEVKPEEKAADPEAEKESAEAEADSESTDKKAAETTEIAEDKPVTEEKPDQKKDEDSAEAKEPEPEPTEEVKHDEKEATLEPAKESTPPEADSESTDQKAVETTETAQEKPTAEAATSENTNGEPAEQTPVEEKPVEEKSAQEESTEETTEAPAEPVSETQPAPKEKSEETKPTEQSDTAETATDAPAKDGSEDKSEAEEKKQDEAAPAAETTPVEVPEEPPVEEPAVSEKPATAATSADNSSPSEPPAPAATSTEEAKDRPQAEKMAEEPKDINPMSVPERPPSVASIRSQHYPQGTPTPSVVHRAFTPTGVYPPPMSHYMPSPFATGHQTPLYHPAVPAGAPYMPMAQPNGMPYGAPPMPYGHFGSQYAPSPPLHRSGSFAASGVSGSFPPGPGSAVAVDDESGELLSRLSSAIPDLHFLLSRYKDTQALQEEMMRRAEGQQAELMKKKEDHIQMLAKEMDIAAKDHAQETAKLKGEISNLEDRLKDTRERIEELQSTKKLLEENKSGLQAQKELLEKEKVDFTNLHATEKEKLIKDLEDFKVQAKEALDKEVLLLGAALNDQRKESEATLEKQKQSLADDHAIEKKLIHENYQKEHAKEKEELEARFQQQKQEIEATFGAVRKHLEDKIKTLGEEVEAAGAKEKEATAEREKLIKEWEEEREKFNKEKQDIQDEIAKAKEDSSKKAEEQRTMLQKKLDELRKEWEDDKEKFDRSFAEMKSMAETREKEKGQLQKMIDSFGEIMDVKTKGDAYYMDAFSQLSNQILEVSTTYFTRYHNLPSLERLSSLPANLPYFMEDSPAANHLRAAFICHTISSLITLRIFTPFLFGLDDGLDSYLSSMSSQLRTKSTRKEAVWRQQTLNTAFTSSDSKHKINGAAHALIDEIMDAVKDYAVPRDEEAIRLALKRVVKLAVETWRYARLEREMITARLPSLEESSKSEIAHGLWLTPTFDPNNASFKTPISVPAEEVDERQLLLRLLPVIQREPVHEALRFSEQEKQDKGYIYNAGLALYDISGVILARRSELRGSGNLPQQKQIGYGPPSGPPPAQPLPPRPREISYITGTSHQSVQAVQQSPPPRPMSPPGRPTSPKSLISVMTRVPSSGAVPVADSSQAPRSPIPTQFKPAEEEARRRAKSRAPAVRRQDSESHKRAPSAARPDYESTARPSIQRQESQTIPRDLPKQRHDSASSIRTMPKAPTRRDSDTATIKSSKDSIKSSSLSSRRNSPPLRDGRSAAVRALYEDSDISSRKDSSLTSTITERSGVRLDDGKRTWNMEEGEWGWEDSGSQGRGSPMPGSWDR